MKKPLPPARIARIAKERAAWDALSERAARAFRESSVSHGDVSAMLIYCRKNTPRMPPEGLAHVTPDTHTQNVRIHQQARILGGTAAGYDPQFIKMMIARGTLHRRQIKEGNARALRKRMWQESIAPLSAALAYALEAAKRPIPPARGREYAQASAHYFRTYADVLSSVRERMRAIERATSMAPGVAGAALRRRRPDEALCDVLRGTLPQEERDAFNARDIPLPLASTKASPIVWTSWVSASERARVWAAYWAVPPAQLDPTKPGGVRALAEPFSVSGPTNSAPVRVHKARAAHEALLKRMLDAAQSRMMALAPAQALGRLDGPDRDDWSYLEVLAPAVSNTLARLRAMPVTAPLPLSVWLLMPAPDRARVDAAAMAYPHAYTRARLAAGMAPGFHVRSASKARGYV